MRMKFRKIVAIILMVLGAIMLARGLMFALRSALGWQGIAQAVIVGSLVFALGFTRWRYLRQR
jgi:hypothetical protein